MPYAVHRHGASKRLVYVATVSRGRIGPRGQAMRRRIGEAGYHVTKGWRVEPRPATMSILVVPPPPPLLRAPRVPRGVPRGGNVPGSVRRARARVAAEPA